MSLNFIGLHVVHLHGCAKNMCYAVLGAVKSKPIALLTVYLFVLLVYEGRALNCSALSVELSVCLCPSAGCCPRSVKVCLVQAHL